MFSTKRTRFVTALFIITMFSAAAFAASETCERALKNLLDGNKRFIGGVCEQKDLSDSKRKELAKGQKPSAIVVTCSDSRVSPELLFDQGLGDVFVIRTAGNVVDKIALGSIEYAAEHLHSPLVFVLGHEKCGAVSAALETVEKKGKAEGNIGAIIEKITPAVITAQKKGGTRDEVLENAIKENARNTSREIMAKSSIIQHLVHEDQVEIVAGEYSLTSGSVEMVELSDNTPPHAPMKLEVH